MGVHTNDARRFIHIPTHSLERSMCTTSKTPIINISNIPQHSLNLASDILSMAHAETPAVQLLGKGKHRYGGQALPEYAGVQYEGSIFVNSSRRANQSTFGTTRVSIGGPRANGPYYCTGFNRGPASIQKVRSFILEFSIGGSRFDYGGLHNYGGYAVRRSCR